MISPALRKPIDWIVLRNRLGAQQMINKMKMEKALERADLTTKGVASAEEGLEQLREQTFDLVFLDHLLPGMNGLEALDVIKADSELRHIPVFMYTSQSAERYRQDAKARGAAGVIGKQVDREQLLTTIEAILTDASTLPGLSPFENTPGELIEQSYTRRLTGRLATLEIALTTGGPMVRFGTKWASITST